MEKKTKLTISGGIAKKSIKNIDKAKNLGKNSVIIEKQTGKFTTFSAFSYEVVELINSKKYISSFTYIFISIFICIMSAYLGTLLNKF